MIFISLLDEASSSSSSFEGIKWFGIVLLFFLPFAFAASCGYIRGKAVSILARNPKMEDFVFKKYMITSTVFEYLIFFSPILGIFLAILAGGG